MAEIEIKLDELLKNKQKELESGANALIFGGVGYEREISVQGALSFLKAAPRDIPIAPIYIDGQGEYNLYLGEVNEGVFEKNALVPVNLVRRAGRAVILTDEGEIPILRAFPLLHGDFGEDGITQGYLSSLGIDFVGSKTIGGAICSDKAYSKLAAMRVGVPTLPFELLYGDFSFADATRLAEKVGYPLFIKPCRLGSSVGAHLVGCGDELFSAIADSRMYADRIMLEPALTDKRELECAYLSLGGVNVITPPGEVVFDSPFYDYDAKYKSRSTKIYPKAEVSESISLALREYTRRLSSELSVRHFARFDYFLTESGEIYFNEVNTIPGMCRGSLYPLMLKEAGIDMQSFIRLAFCGEV